MLDKKHTYQTDQRKAENRTKIQLGGLILKSGLADFLSIVPGDDLQLDSTKWDQATILLGALIESVERGRDDVALKETWAFLGEKEMRLSFITDKHSR